MRLSHILAATAALTLSGTAVLADKFVGYGAVDGWNVHIDTEKGTCLVETKDGLDNVIQMGLTEDRAIGVVAVLVDHDPTRLVRGDLRDDDLGDRIRGLIAGDDRGGRCDSRVLCTGRSERDESRDEQQGESL